MTKEELKEQDVRLNKLCFDYQGKDKRIAELEKRCNELFFQLNEKTESISDLEKENAGLRFIVDYAKAVMRELLDNSNEYARQKAEDFIKE